MATGTGPRPSTKPKPPPVGKPRPEDTFVITSTNDATRARFSTVLYKGPPLSGKTYSIGSWTALGPLLYILHDPKRETIEAFPDVHIIAPKDMFQFRERILPRILEGTLTDSNGKPLDYANVALDSLSFGARETELEVMGTGDEMPNGGWNIFATRISRMLSNLGTIARSPSSPHPANFLSSIHEQEKQKRVKDAQGNNQFVSDGWLPKISGSVRTLLEGYFDLTLLTYKFEHVFPPDPANPNMPRKSETRYACRTVGLEKRQQAGGSFRGLRKIPPIIDGTYPGLCKLAGISPATGKPLEDDPASDSPKK